MFQWKINQVSLKLLGILSCGILFGAFSVGLVFSTLQPAGIGQQSRQPDALAAAELSDQQLEQAEWSVSIQDFENSNPRGRSYFDYVFSKMQNGNRVYDVPYPFNRIIDRLTNYLGYPPDDEKNSPLLRMLFPMGRSLQRNAALDNEDNYDENLFYRYPRVVVGVAQENQRPTALNLKARLYLGFHERSKVIEVISYNDIEGRFEYQVVRDYESGKTPKVFYANRQLCLSCHQNQTPIFSVGPWNESNAHANVFHKIEDNMKSELGENKCDTLTQNFCYRQSTSLDATSAKEYFYFGSPTRIDLNIPNTFDNLTDLGNYFHALQKSWLNLCGDIQCQRWILKSVMKYVLSGQDGIYNDGDHLQRLQRFENDFQRKFPSGLKIPSPNIPNRDPQKSKNLSQAEAEVAAQVVGKNQNAQQSLQDLLQQNAVAGEFEPLMPRSAIELWNNTEIDQKLSNRMIRGFAEFFSKQDGLLLDRWLAGKSHGQPVHKLKSQCQVSKLNAETFSVVCPPSPGGQILLQNARIVVKDQRIVSGGLDNLILIAAKSNGEFCDFRVAQTIANRVSGLSCPSIAKASFRGHLQGDELHIIPYRQDGMHARLLRGNLIKQIIMNIQSGVVEVSTVNDIDLLLKKVDEMQFLDPITRRVALLPFSRKLVMASIAKSLEIPELNLDEDQQIETLEKNLDEDVKSEGQIQAQVKSPLNGLMESCGMCHYNFEGVPPAFLGLKQAGINDLEKCERIKTCAARILYRIKMRNCSPQKIAQFQKNPMPLPIFFQRAKVKPQWWQETIAPQLVNHLKEMISAQELNQHLISQGIDQSAAQKTIQELLNSSCPEVDYNIYESLPRCNFSNEQTVSESCQNLVPKWQNQKNGK